MTAILRVLDNLARVLLGLAGLALVAMMVVVIIDIVLRNFGNYIPGVSSIRLYGMLEAIRYLFLIAMAGAMPWGVEKSQVIVELFTQKLSAPVLARIDSFFLLGFAAFGAALTYALILSGLSAMASGQTTPDLQIPMSWVRFFTAFCMALLTVRAFFVGLRGIILGKLHVA